MAPEANRPGEDRLRPLFDRLDVDGTENRLRGALSAETTDEGRAEVLTQLARVELAHGRLGAAQSLVDQASDLAGPSGGARERLPATWSPGPGAGSTSPNGTKQPRTGREPC